MVGAAEEEILVCNERYKILIVDDNEGNTVVLSEILGQLNQCEITSVMTGNDALKQILKVDHHLIILDIKLPDIDGYELARILKSNRRTIDIPIIFCSAIFTTEEFIKKGFELGAIDYLLKPVKEEQLLNKINYYISLHEKQTGLIHELMMSNKELEKQNRVKTEFLANMSHEIRTPMNGVLGMAQLLQMSSLSSEQEDYVEILISSGKILLKMINDILDYSKLENGKAKIEQVEFSLKEVVQKVMVSYVSVADRKNLRLSHHINSDIPDSLQGDPIRLQQILNNLLSNALKFTRVGSIRLNISMLSYSENITNLSLVLSDTGIGIPSQIVDDIFEKFTQADSSTTKAFGGTGIGLSITKSLVSIMGGSIRVESRENVGSSFIVNIPFQVSTSTF